MERKKYYELTVMTYIRKNIEYNKHFEIVGNMNNHAMIKDNMLNDRHGKDGYKGYSITGIYPINKDGIYKKGDIGSYKIITYDKDIKDAFERVLMSEQNEYLVVTDTFVKERLEGNIDEIHTYTPCVVTLNESERIASNKKNWIANDYSEDSLIQKIENNLIKKYKQFFNEDLQQGMIQEITIRNKLPKIINYKNTKLLGNQINIKVNKDENSQKLANLAVVLGLGEKTSCLGMGNCRGIYSKVVR